MKKTIGILGGMGPEATAHMYQLLIQHTAAQRDQDHIKVVIYSNPKTPPRTDPILGDGPSPVPALVEGLEKLKGAGADFVIVPCVTAHYYMPDALKQVDVPFLSILDAALEWVKFSYPEIRRVGLIASTGTRVSGLFHETFGRGGIEILSTAWEDQARVMEAIFGDEGIKCGHTAGMPKETIVTVARRLIALGAEAIVAGCTEVPLVLKGEDISVPFVEPMEILAKKSILEAGYKVR